MLETSWGVTSNIEEVLFINQPNNRQYLRNLEFDPEINQGFSESLRYSLHADPLPPPPDISTDPIAKAAILRQPNLFKIVCPIHIPRLALLLKNTRTGSL